MAKLKTTYACQSCGATYPRWNGQCDACGAWNTIAAETASNAAPVATGVRAGKGHAERVQLENLSSQSPELPRTQSQIAEWDRVLGGGFVAGSVTLIGGDPGIGKSTLLLQIVAQLANANKNCLYVSGEESVDQVRLRARRLGLSEAPLKLAAATNIGDILAASAHIKDLALLVVDSIQTMFAEEVESAPGTVAQVRACTQAIIQFAKSKNISVVIVGHVTKDGLIAGPRVLEHMVDTVLYFEGDRGHQFRILRGVKNRFGPTDEIGVFEMAGTGLVEVPNPSALFLSDRHASVPGNAVFAGLEGTRPMLVEIQALVVDTPFSTPKRQAVGYDAGRLSMILAVLEARCGILFSGQDVYLNVAGGLKITEPAADLAVAAALVSALHAKPLPEGAVFFGEVGLSGEIRAVAQPDIRLKEAFKLGFQAGFIPKAGKTSAMADMNLEKLAVLANLQHTAF